MSPQQVAKMIGMRGLRADEPLTRYGDIPHTVVHLFHDCLLANETGDGVTVFAAFLDIFCYDALAHQWAHAVVHKYYIVVGATGVAKSFETIAYGMLVAVAALENPFQLSDVELVGVSLEDDLPPFQADHGDGIHQRMPLKRLHGVDDDRDVVDGHKLFRDILSHPVADTAGGKQCYVHRSW